MRSLTLLTLGLVAVLSACGNGLPGIAPTLSITSPTNNSSVSLSPNKTIAVNFNTNYLLKAPMTCGTIENCGHVYVLVDNTDCNSTNMIFNTLAVSSPTDADFGKCATATGMHTITLELHYDDGVIVKDLFNNPVTTKVTVTTQ